MHFPSYRLPYEALALFSSTEQWSDDTVLHVAPHVQHDILALLHSANLVSPSRVATFGPSIYRKLHTNVCARDMQLSEATAQSQHRSGMAPRPLDSPAYAAPFSVELFSSPTYASALAQSIRLFTVQVSFRAHFGLLLRCPLPLLERAGEVRAGPFSHNVFVSAPDVGPRARALHRPSEPPQWRTEGNEHGETGVDGSMEEGQRTYTSSPSSVDVRMVWRVHNCA